MKITENGFSERLSTPVSRTEQTATGSTSASATPNRSASSDSLQLSSIAARLQQSSGTDPSRSARLAAIANAVKSNSFKVDATQISKAMISEAAAGSAG